MTPVGWLVVAAVVVAAMGIVIRALQWRNAALEWAAVVVATSQSAGVVMDEVARLGKSATSFTQTHEDRVRWRAKEVTVNEMVPLAVRAAEQLHRVQESATTVVERRKLERVA